MVPPPGQNWAEVEEKLATGISLPEVTKLSLLAKTGVSTDLFDIFQNKLNEILKRAKIFLGHLGPCWQHFNWLI